MIPPRPATANPQPGAEWSTTNPTAGAPAAAPSVNADDCMPIASPRAAAGASRLTCSPVAATVGAHSADAGTRASASHHH
jgi:hypothetical protein